MISNFFYFFICCHYFLQLSKSIKCTQHTIQFDSIVLMDDSKQMRVFHSTEHELLVQINTIYRKDLKHFWLDANRILFIFISYILKVCVCREKYGTLSFLKILLRLGLDFLFDFNDPSTSNTICIIEKELMNNRRRQTKISPQLINIPRTNIMTTWYDRKRSCMTQVDRPGLINSQ